MVYNGMDYWEHVERAEHASNERERIREAAKIRASYEAYYPRMILQKMSAGSIFWSDRLFSYAIDDEKMYEYSGGGSPYHRRLLSADINSAWEEIALQDVPKGLVWVSPPSDFKAILKDRVLSIVLPRLEQLRDECIGFAWGRTWKDKRTKEMRASADGLYDALTNAKSFQGLHLESVLGAELEAIRKWEASLTPKTPIFGRDALAFLKEGE